MSLSNPACPKAKAPLQIEQTIILLSEQNIPVENINISSDTRYNYLETFFVKSGNNILTTVKTKDSPQVIYNKSAETVTIIDTNRKETQYKIGDENLKSALEEVFKQNILVNINRTNFTSGIYTDIKVENGELKVKNNSNYYSWLYNNIKVSASKPNAEGQIVALNPLFRYTLPDLDTLQKTPDVQQETAPVEEKTVEEQDNENLNPGNPDLFNLSFDDLFRATNLENAVTEEQISDAEKWWANSPLSKVIPLNRLLSVVNSNAWATFSRSGITLYKGSSSVDIYHEAWHGFTQLYLTTEEKVKLYKEVRKKPGVFTTVNGEVVSFSDASFFQIEEYLAEQFRDYAQFQNPEKGSPAKNTIFRKIWNFLKSLFGGTNRNAVYVDAMSVPAVAEAFEKLYFGKLLNLQPNINNSMFDVLNRAKSVKDETPLNIEDEEFDLIRQSIDGLVAKALVNIQIDGTRSNNLAFLYSSKARTKIFEGILNTFKNKLADINEELENLEEKPSNLLDQKRLLEIVIENFGDIESFANNKKTNGILAAYAQTSSAAITNLVVAEEDIEIDYDLDTSNSSELLQQTGDKRANSRAMKDYLPKELTTILRLIPSFRVATQKEINSKSYDFSIGEEKFVYMKNKLGFPINQDFGPTLNALQKTVVGVKTYTEMLDAIKNAQNAFPVLKVIYELLPKEHTLDRALAQDYNRAKILIEVIVGFYTAFDKASVEALINTKSNVLVDENTTDTKQTFTSGKATNSVGNVFKRWQNIFLVNAPRVNNEALLNTKNLPNKVNNFEEAFEFFERLGVQLTKTTKEVIQAQKSGITLNELLSAANVMLNDIRSNPNNKKLKSNPLQVFIEKSTDSNISYQRTIFRKIAEIEIKYNPLFNDSIILNANGDLVSSISLHNSMTRKIMYLNESINLLDASNFNVEFNEELNPFFKYSIIRGRLFDEKGNRTDFNNLELMFHVGYQERDEYDNIENASSATDLTINQKFITDFYSFILQGYMPTLVHESKSSVYVPMITDRNGSSELYLQPKLFEKALLPDDAIRLLQRYIKAEYERIVLFKTNDTYKQNQALNKDGAGEKFTAFDDILRTKTKKALYADIDNGLTSDESVKKNIDAIKEDLESYFTEVNKQNQNRYNQSAKLVPVDKTELVKFRLNVKDAELNKTLVRAYTVNYFIHRFEMNNFFYGDMAQYNHKKEAGTKYDAGAGSGGPGFISDPWVLQAINKAYPKVYSEKVMSELRPDGVVKETTSTLNTAIIQEDTGLRSVSLNEMIEAVVKLKAKRENRTEKAVRPEVVQSFEKAYGTEMKIGDGHAYMTIDTYRHLKIAQDNWLPEQEALYQKIVNGEKLDVNDAKVFFPTYKLQMQGNLQTDAPITALHKFSISPLIPNVHADSLLNDIHNLMIINNIDYITYPSGSKISNLGNPTDLYENGDRNKINMSTEFTVNPVNLAYLKEVTSNTNVWKAGQTFATQMRKLIVENLYLNGTIIEDKKELEKDYLRLVDEVTKNLEKDFLDEIGWVKEGNTYSGPVERLAAFLQTQLRKKNLPEHIVKQIFVDANGNLTNDLSALPNAQTIEAIMFSTISRRLIKQKSYGEGLVQVPGSFWRKADESERKKWLGTNDFLPNYKYNPKNIQAAKVAITLHGDFINLFQRKDLNGNIIAVYDIVEEEDGTKKRVLDVEASRVKLNQLIKNDKWLDQDDNRQAISILGVRIPVQGQGSIDALEVYEFLPIGAGNIIVLPSEIVGKSGGDFDFDKLPSLFPRINKNGKIISAKKYKTRQALLDELAKLEKENNLDKKDVIERVKTLIKDLKADKKVNKETISNIIRNLEYAKLSKEFIVDEINKLIKTDLENGQLQFLPSPLQKVLSKPDYTDGDIIKALRTSAKILTKDKSRSILEKFNKRLFDQIIAFDRIKTDELDNLYEELKNAFQDKNQLNNEIEESVENLKEIIYVLDVENNYVGALQTDLLQTSLEIILSPQNYESLITPNSTDIFDDLADKLKRLTQTYDPLLNFSGESTGVISPTRLFESDYNLSKYEAYMTAMDALGIGAIMTTYNILLNSLKGVSPKEYVLDKKEKVTVPIRMLLPNNVTKEGNISLHNTYSYRTDEKEALVRISDVFNQMINGWVDVGANPWIFYIQGNKEITPVLMYMLMAGVPVEHAVYFVSQSLVRRFIALKKERGASEAYKILLNNKNKNEIILNSLNNEEEFQLNDLKNQLISENVDAEYQEKVLRHFIEISNISEAFTKFSRATNVDTTRENSYLSTREREASLNDLLYDGRIDRSLVEAIQNSEKSMIGSFFIGDFAIALTKSVLPFRFDARIDNFINKLSGKIETDNTEFNSLQEGYRRLSNSQTSNKATGTELLDAAFRDELILALYQNAVRGFRLGVSDSYKGFGVSETTPVQYVDYLKKGVYLTKDKIYISASEIQRKYESLSNDFRNNEFSTIHEYTRFLIERAIVELTQPNSTDSQKENRAYINSFNLYKLFQDPGSSFANVFYKNILKKDFSEELTEQFPVLSYFLTNSKMYPGYVILDFIGKNIDDITATSYHSQLKQLQDFISVKNRMPNLSDSNIKLINYVFTMLPQIAFLQNGFSKNVSNLVNLVDLSEVNATVQDAISGFNFSEQSLLNFAEGFISGQTRKTKVPVRQYSLAPVKIDRSELVPGAFSYRLPGGETIRSNYVPSKNFTNLLFTNEQYGYYKPYDYYDLVIKQDQTGGVYVVYPTTLDKTEAARSPYLRNTTTRAKYLPISIGFKEVGDGFIEGGQPTVQPTQPSTSVKEDVLEVADGIKIIKNSITPAEELELFNELKSYLEAQGSQTNKGTSAPIMIGLGLRWDYTSNNAGKTPIELGETINNNQSQKNKYRYYNVAHNGQPLGVISQRLKSLVSKATGFDATNYDGAIINIYPKNGFISAHNDVDESVTAINYPVLVLNIGGDGSLSVEGAESQKAKKGYAQKEYTNTELKSGDAYVFGEDGLNRDVFHRTLPSSGKGTLPELNIQGKIIPANSYRITITLRRVQPLKSGMPTAPAKITTQPSTSVKEGVSELFESKPTLANSVYEAMGFEQGGNLSEKNLFTVEPIQSVDKKAKAKAKIATQYIGFAEGIAGSSTALYGQQANEEYNKALSEANKRPNTTNIPQNLQSGIEQYGTLQYANREAQELIGKNVSSIELIENGIRTRTTRTDKELEKYDIKVGSYIKMFGKDQFGNTKNVIVKITKITKGYNDTTWYKEGWTEEGLGKLKAHTNSANAVEFEVIKPKANTGNYSSADTIFVSIGGKRGSEVVRKEQQDKTIREAIKALEAGATLITDNAAYVESNSYNEGEKRLAVNLKAKGYNYSETTVDGNVLGVWNKSTNQITPQQKQQAQQAYSNYLATGKQDIQGFKEFVGKPSTQPSPVVQGNTPSIEEAKKRINEQLSQIEEILSNPRNAVVMDMSLLINDILKQNTPQIAGSKNIAEYLYSELYKRFNLPVPGSSKFGVMDLIIENQEGIAGETLVSEDLIGLDLDGTCFRV